jgi:hypothetical protein
MIDGQNQPFKFTAGIQFLSRVEQKFKGAASATTEEEL